MRIVYFDDEFAGSPPVLDMMDFIRPMVSVEDPDKEARHPVPWYLACLMADYRRGSFQQLNHFMPLFSKTHMADGTWTTLAQTCSRKIAKQLEKCAKNLPDSDESEDEFSASAKEHLLLLQRQKDFFDLMQKIDLLPAVVPGDGNCALWSILASMGGPIQKAQMSTAADIKALREDT